MCLLCQKKRKSVLHSWITRACLGGPLTITADWITWMHVVPIIFKKTYCMLKRINYLHPFFKSCKSLSLLNITHLWSGMYWMWTLSRVVLVTWNDTCLCTQSHTHTLSHTVVSSAFPCVSFSATGSRVCAD